MVTVRVCSTLPEAQVIQSQLEGSGIAAFLPDEMTVQADWLWANAIGGVRVQVAEEDAEQAAEILHAGVVGKAPSIRTCPACGASMRPVNGRLGSFFRTLLVLFFGLPLRAWKCPACGARSSG